MIHLEELENKIKQLEEKHTSDPDLNHVIGKDSDCLYCEQYKQLLKEQKQYKTSTKKPSIVTFKKGVQAKKAQTKQLFEVTLNDGSKYMVYAVDRVQIAQLLKIPLSTIKKETVLPAKYWEGIYVESPNSSLKTVQQMIPTNHSRIVAEYAISNDESVRRYCYNDTPFEYLIYNEQQFDLLERFAKPYIPMKTKKFNTTGRVTIQTPTGSLGVSPDEVLLKITSKLLVVLDKKDFQKNFTQEENYVWTMR